MKSEPIDDSDQAELVSTMKNDATKQILRIVAGVSLICRLAAILTFCVSLAEFSFSSLHSIPFSHLLYSGCAHLFVDRVFLSRIRRTIEEGQAFIKFHSKELSTYLALNIIPLFVSIVIHGNISFPSFENVDASFTYYALMLGNLLTSLACLWVQYEWNDVHMQLTKLETSQYHYKSV